MLSFLLLRRVICLVLPVAGAHTVALQNRKERREEMEKHPGKTAKRPPQHLPLLTAANLQLYHYQHHYPLCPAAAPTTYSPLQISLRDPANRIDVGGSGHKVSITGTTDVGIHQLADRPQDDALLGSVC